MMLNNWIRATMVLALILSVVSRAEAKPPNIVMIISDDQRWTDFGFMGHPVIQTPNLDEFATQSLVFPRGYVPSSLCRPSLATLVTGLYAHQHKITGNEPPIPPGGKNTPIYRQQRHEMIAYIDKVPLLAKMLGEIGYVSHQSGKWWEGHSSRGGFTEGMTLGFPSPGGRHGDAGLRIGREGMKPVFDFVDSAGDKPFFIYYAPFLPHTPHNPPERLLSKYQDKTDSPYVAKYWAMCEWFDETCGELLDYLDEKDLADDTIVLFVTDNGWIQRANARGYAPRSKRSPHDGGVRTPIMVRWPGKVKPRRVNTPVISTDLVPSILAACGLEPTADMQGINLLDEEKVDGRKAIFGEIFGHNAVDIHKPVANLHYRWCIEGDWKLIVPNKLNMPDGENELYDLAKDPHEEKNLAEERPDRVEKMKKMIDQWWEAAS